jgi:hypothetical protein
MMLAFLATEEWLQNATYIPELELIRLGYRQQRKQL